ncbi:hypothetical protein EIP91_010374 [Steccherinum ochraceum]|uniref:Uncharacterized protein n=1 Tax=Steccherinum ochraceum TaxID=92696 RepID=A0A4R0RQU4_9APHY|nr:hypothetical protein EIP91_010374 [Steccherinum ochraceum]
MSMVKTYVASQLSDSRWLDRATIIGFDLAYLAYGVHATLFFTCLTYLWPQRRANPRQTYGWITYISILFTLGSIANGVDMHMGQVIFVDNWNYPGGPGAFSRTVFTVPVNILCTGACAVGGWFMDALLIFRFHIIVGPPKWLLAVPVAMLIVSIVMSCLLLAQLTHSASTIWDKINLDVELAYWSTTIATNLLLTFLIVIHLMRVRHKVLKASGTTSHLPYLSVSAMLVEAAVLYAAFGLAFIIPYALGSSVNTLFFSLIGQVQYITPLLIILRVAQGRAYSESDRRRMQDSEMASSSRYRPRGDTTMSSQHSSGELVFKPPISSTYQRDTMADESTTTKNILTLTETNTTSNVSTEVLNDSEKGGLGQQ